jgi:hypothetical protein
MFEGCFLLSGGEYCTFIGWKAISQSASHLAAASRSDCFFSQHITLGYMAKTLNQIIFFSLNQNQNIFSATLGIFFF